MGNTTTKTNSRDLKETVDKIASNLILKQTFEDMTNMDNENYCNNLIVISSNILEKKFNKREVKYIASKLFKESLKEDDKYNEKISFILRKDLDNLDIKDDELKKEMCMYISKFYIKLANLWYAIISTVNPVLTYYNNENKKVNADFGSSNEELKKQKIDDTNIPVEISNRSFCEKRINILNKSLILDNDEYILKKNYVCQNSNSDFKNEPGIPELEDLYYDEYDKNKFTNIREKNKSLYKKDLESFYKAFTGKSLPNDVKRFSDIKISHMSKNINCSKDDLEYKFSKDDILSDKLFRNYANLLKKMILNKSKKKKKLIKIVDELFIINKETNEVIINPQLKSKRLDELIVLSRNIILDLYVGCEKDYIELEKILNTIIKTFLPLRIEKENLNNLKELNKEEYYEKKYKDLENSRLMEKEEEKLIINSYKNIPR